MPDEEILALAKLMWDYHQMHHKLQKSDCILALGSHDLRVAERAADLYLQGWAPWLLMSGGLGNFTKSLWKEKEADKFAAIALQKGVPQSALLIENQSTNTGENILFSQRLLEEKGLQLQAFMVVQKPYMERRAYATFKKHWQDKDLVVTSPQISFEEYPNSEIPLEHVIHIMVGDLQRIKFYPQKGFQIYQHIPLKVWDAYERLVALGFDRHLIKE